MYKETGSFRFWCQKVLPLVYDNSLSYYELLCKVVDYLNDVIANADYLNDEVVKLKKQFEELKKYVEDYFDNLDVQDEINKKLDDMTADGTLEQIIFSKMQYNYPITYLKNKFFYPFDTVRRTGLELGYTQCQGACLYGDNILVSFNSLDVNSTVIREYNKNTGALIRESIPNAYGHSNTMATNGVDIFTIAPNGVDILRVRYDDLSIVETIILDRKAEGVTTIGSLSYYNGKFYIGNRIRLGVYNSEFKYESEFAVDYGLNDYRNLSAWQGFTIHKGYLYGLSYHANVITKHTLNGTYINTYSIVNDKLSATEPEWLLFLNDNDDFLMGFSYHTSRNAMVQYMIVSRGNLNKSAFGHEPTSGSPVYSRLDIYCDANTNNVYMDGTQQYPFKDIALAIDVANNGDYKNNYIIVASGTYAPFELQSSKSITFVKNGSTKPIVEYAYISNVFMADIREIVFGTSNNENALVFLTTNLINSIKFTYCTFVCKDDAERNLDFGANCSTVYFYGCEFIGGKIGCFMTTGRIVSHNSVMATATVNQNEYTMYYLNSNVVGDISERFTYRCFIGSAAHCDFVELFSNSNGISSGTINFNGYKYLNNNSRAIMYVTFKIENESFGNEFVVYLPNNGLHVQTFRIFSGNIAYYDAHLTKDDNGITFSYNRKYTNGEVTDGEFIKITNVRVKIGY